MYKKCINGIWIALIAALSACAPAEKEQSAPADDKPPAIESATPEGTATERVKKPVELVENDAPPPGAAREFPKTKFAISTVPFSEVISGGPPRDGIPAIREPRFEPVSVADDWLGNREMVFVIDGAPYGSDEVHIYPVQIFIYHEIVNDIFNDTNIAVTYCPLCNSALAFRAQTEDGQQLTLGVSGRLRYSNMIMFDDQNETWWQQATGEAIVGDLVGQSLPIVPLVTLSWAEAKRAYPDAHVLSRQTGFNRPYGRNPYTGYDTLQHPFLYRGPEIDPSRDPFARVLVVELGGKQQEYFYNELRSAGITVDRVGGTDIVIFWDDQTASPLDQGNTDEGRIVGSANAFQSGANGQKLTFSLKGNGEITDSQTGSSWSPSGIAVSGELSGTQLTAVPSIQHFWFSYAIFNVREK